MENKKIAYKQVYRSSWEHLEEFKGKINLQSCILKYIGYSYSAHRWGSVLMNGISRRKSIKTLCLMPVIKFDLKIY